MAEPIIDVQVYDEKRSSPLLVKRIAEFKLYLMNPTVLEAIAAHEAGHELYFKKAGATHFDYLGPRIKSTKDGSDFVCLPPLAYASVFDAAYLARGEEMISLAARACVAGGSVSKVVMRLANRGDEGDFNRFIEICNSISGVERAVEIEYMAYWSQAQTDVDAEVLRPNTRSQIMKLARKNRIRLFKW